MLLRPYSLGHELWLSKLGNPLWFSDYANPRELYEAVLICSQTWRQIDQMPWEPLIRLKLWIWKRRSRKMNFKTELLKFSAYRDSGQVEFPLSEVTEPTRGQSRLPGCPFLLRLQQWLMLNLRLSEAESWDYPYGMAKCRWACHWEQEEGLRIYNAHDAEFDRFVEDQERKGQEQCQA
jgi:hypothetical protein